jgi:8-oxo-dGTP diphosphatase
VKPDHAVTGVGVGVLVIRDDRVLLGERRGSHGAGTWALPGGHLEHGESAETCAARELEEETGLQAGRLVPGPYTTDMIEPEGLHYVTLFVVATGVTGEPIVREPAKCARWEWFRWSALPEPLFAPLESLRRQGYVLTRR